MKVATHLVMRGVGEPGKARVKIPPAPAKKPELTLVLRTIILNRVASSLDCESGRMIASEIIEEKPDYTNTARSIIERR